MKLLVITPGEDVLDTGEITNGNVHVHVCHGREGDQALTGHLHRATVESFFVHAYVLAL